MASTTTASTTQPQEKAVVRVAAPSRPPLRIAPFTILVYLLLTLGAILFAMPFFWMISTSLMNQSESTSGAFIPQSEIIGVHPVEVADLNRPMGEFLEARREFSFVGQQVIIIYDEVPNGGTFDVFIDGFYITSQDTHSDEVQRNQPLPINAYPAVTTLDEANSSKSIPLPNKRHQLRIEYNPAKSGGRTEFWLYGIRVPQDADPRPLQFGLSLTPVQTFQSVSEVISLQGDRRVPYGNWETVYDNGSTWEEVTWNNDLGYWQRTDGTPVPESAITYRATHLGFPEYFDESVIRTIALSASNRSEPQETHIRRRAIGGYAVMEFPFGLIDQDYVVTGGASNYVKVWNDSDFAAKFVNSVMIVTLVILGQTVFSLFAAYAFARMKFPGQNILFMIFLTTLFIPFMVILIPNVLTVTSISRWSEDTFGPLFDDLGQNVFFFNWIGLDASDASWLGNWPSLVVPFWASTFAIFLLRQFFLQIPNELWDAAQIDGAGHLRFLFQIIVPISRAAIMTTILFTFIGTWDAFEWPIIVASDEWEPIAVALYFFQSTEGSRPNLVMAGAMISLFPIITLYLITQKQFTEGIATTGLKG